MNVNDFAKFHLYQPGILPHFLKTARVDYMSFQIRQPHRGIDCSAAPPKRDPLEYMSNQRSKAQHTANQLLQFSIPTTNDSTKY